MIDIYQAGATALAALIGGLIPTALLFRFIIHDRYASTKARSAAARVAWWLGFAFSVGIFVSVAGLLAAVLPAIFLNRSGNLDQAYRSALPLVVWVLLLLGVGYGFRRHGSIEQQSDVPSPPNGREPPPLLETLLTVSIFLIAIVVATMVFLHRRQQ
jgi:hypothetical protein